MRYRKLIFEQVRKEDSISEIAKAIMIVLANGKWKSVECVLWEAEIKPNNPHIFSALESMRCHGLAEICGNIFENRNTHKAIRLTEEGRHHIKNYQNREENNAYIEG